VSRATTDQSKSAVAKAQVVLITDGALVRSLLSRNIGEWTERGRSKSTHGRGWGRIHEMAFARSEFRELRLSQKFELLERRTGLGEMNGTSQDLWQGTPLALCPSL
jgi:hypothetical protein